MDEQIFDIFVIGGGINGVGVARDAVGRGLTVGLCEKDDIAQHTSSASTKLIHGGLRYLEQYDFALVRKALIEREVLLRAAPHIIWPLRFVIPLGRGGRPAWMIRLGLFLYDSLGGRRLLPATRSLNRSRNGVKFDALKSEFDKGYEYSDCWVDDARLSVLNAVDAAERGACILTRTRCVGLQRGEHYWTITLSKRNGEVMTVRSKTIVNAAGPWVDQIVNLADQHASNQASVRLVKGSHIIVPKLYEGDHCYFFQNPDGRIFFAIPYLDGTRTLIGTTDIPTDRSTLDDTRISTEEIDYLCDSASAYFKTAITADQVVSTYAGVRPLYDDQSEDASKVTRDYVLKYDGKGVPAILSVFGGKITTFRTLAEHVLEQLENDLPHMGASWTKDVPLPGGDIPDADFDHFVEKAIQQYPGFSPQLIHRYARLYGTRLALIIGGASSEAELGTRFGHDLYQAELTYLMKYEFAQTAEDVLMRRTKLGLMMSEADQKQVAKAMPA